MKRNLHIRLNPGAFCRADCLGTGGIRPVQRAQPQLLLSGQRLPSLRAVRLHHASVSVRTRNARRTGNAGHAVHA